MEVFNMFKLGDKVYHNSPDSPEGLIIEIRHYMSTDVVEYLVSWNYNETNWYTEVELSANRRF